MLITIKSIKHEEKVGKTSGKPFTSCQITVVGKDGKDFKLSGFGSDITKTWHSGDQVDVDVSKTDAGYWNFSENAESRPSEDQTIKYLKLIYETLQKMSGNAPKANTEMTASETDKILKEFEAKTPDFLKN